MPEKFKNNFSSFQMMPVCIFSIFASLLVSYYQMIDAVIDLLH